MLGLLSTAGYLACNAPEFLLEILEEEEIAFVRRHHQNHKTDGKVHLRISNLLRRTRSATSGICNLFVFVSLIQPLKAIKYVNYSSALGVLVFKEAHSCTRLSLDVVVYVVLYLHFQSCLKVS